MNDLTFKREPAVLMRAQTKVLLHFREDRVASRRSTWSAIMEEVAEFYASVYSGCVHPPGLTPWDFGWQIPGGEDERKEQIPQPGILSYTF